MDEFKILELENKIKELENRIGDASTLLWDYDGYYDSRKQTGDIVGLASLIKEAFYILQGKHWEDMPEPMPDEHHDIEE